jgi:hypothetical protein
MASWPFGYASVIGHYAWDDARSEEIKTDYRLIPIVIFLLKLSFAVLVLQMIGRASMPTCVQLHVVGTTRNRISASAVRAAR